MKKTKILVVDDRIENIKALSLLIDSEQIEILSALSAEEALEVMIDQELGLAILDVQMPGMSGFELARLIRGVKKFQELPIIFVTAHNRDQSFIFEGYGTGAVDLLFKPLDPQIVRSKVSVFVQIDQQKRKLKDQIQEMKSLRAAAETANLAKSRFLANMSHEIRTPLGAVMGFADILSEPQLSETERAQFAGAIQRNGQLLLRIIDDILDFSKIEAQKLNLENVDFELDELLQDVMSVLKPKAEEKGISLELEKAPQVKGFYRSDPVRIKQILFNLIGNAIKFTNEGFVKFRIRKESEVETEPKKDLICIEIEDSGVGLTEDQTKNIFKPFGQADSSTKRQFGGTGLGLVIAKQLAKALGGDLELKASTPGEGSIFELQFALESINENEFLQGFGAGSSKSADGRHRILLVDDIEDNRTLIQFYLPPKSYEIVTASNGIEALEIAEASEPDLILMDVSMPEMDGYEATRILRERGFEKPIVALTAHAGKTEVENCLKAGYSLVLSKPVQRQNLITTLEKLLDSTKAPSSDAPLWH